MLVLVGVALLGLLGVTVVVLLTRGITSRGAVEVVRYDVVDPTHLLLAVDSCNGDPRVVSMAQPSDAVTVSVEATTSLGGAGEDCLDQVSITLAAPLAARPLVDGSNSRVVPKGTGG